MDGEALAVLAAALLIGTPILSLLGAIGAALTLGLRASGSLLALLILPLYVPVLIFGAGAVDAARTGLGASAHLSLLGAGLLIACVGAPFAAAAAVRIALGLEPQCSAHGDCSTGSNSRRPPRSIRSRGR